MAAIVSGEVAMSFNTPAATATYIKAGRVRGLAITGAKRYAALPDIPTLTEAGINGVEADPFWGVVMPTGTPQTIISRLHELWTKPVNAPDTRARLLDMGFVPVANTPAEFATQIRNDTAKWIRVIKAAGIQPQ